MLCGAAFTQLPRPARRAEPRPRSRLGQQRPRRLLGQLAVMGHARVRARRAGPLASMWAASLACGRARAPATTGLSALRWAIRRSRLGRLCAGRSRVRPALLGLAALRVGPRRELRFPISSKL